MGLGRLIRALAELPGLDRMRYTTSHPRDVDDELIAAHRDVPQLMPFLHLPVQSGSDRVLAAMNRRHTADDYRRIVERLRAARPDLALSSDFIVGYPGESDADFAATLDLVRESASPRPFRSNIRRGPARRRRRAADQVPEPVKAERLAACRRCWPRQQRAFNERLRRPRPAGAVRKAGPARGQLVGRSPYLQSVHVAAAPERIGEIVPVTIRAAQPNSLAGLVASRQAVRHEQRCRPRCRRRSGRGAHASSNSTTICCCRRSTASATSISTASSGSSASRWSRAATGWRSPGPASATEAAHLALTHLYDRLKRGQEIDLPAVEAAHPAGAGRARRQEPQPVARGRRRSAPASAASRRARAAQAAYIKAMREHELVFGLGPAGTGKTYLAVAAAVDLLMTGTVERIILSRPAVEAGERLGFLPGDLREKVDPYLRPIFDALNDMLPADQLARRLASGEIEVAPLAFMRGRTLAHAFVILDEAQNTTPVQMKMFLTRLGEGSRMVVTGDPTQVDLPPGRRSGLAEALETLRGVEGIAIVRLHRQGRGAPRAGGAHRRAPTRRATARRAATGP